MLGAESSGGGSAAVLIVVYLVVAVLAIAGMWMTFTKAGQKGWTSIIPILNTLVMLKIVKRPLWWIILLLIPCVNIVVLIIVLNEMSKAYGHGVGFTVGLILLGPIFFLILGFGSSQYQLEKDPLF